MGSPHAAFQMFPMAQGMHPAEFYRHLLKLAMHPPEFFRLPMEPFRRTIFHGVPSADLRKLPVGRMLRGLFWPGAGSGFRTPGAACRMGRESIDRMSWFQNDSYTGLSLAPFLFVLALFSRLCMIVSTMRNDIRIAVQGPDADRALAELLSIEGLTGHADPPEPGVTRDPGVLEAVGTIVSILGTLVGVAAQIVAWRDRKKAQGARISVIIEDAHGQRFSLENATTEQVAAALQSLAGKASS